MTEIPVSRLIANETVDPSVLALVAAFDEDPQLAAIEARADALIQSDNELLRSLIALRDHHRLSQSDVARRMGVTQPTVAAFERYDANPTLATIRRYALAVDAKVVHFVQDVCSPAVDTFTKLMESTSIAGPAIRRTSDIVDKWDLDDWAPASPVRA
ncbi:hypothetical protein BH10PLA2_BH10PLA2_01690 [soil metagenome]